MLIGFHLGISDVVYLIISVVSFRLGSGGKMYVPLDKYSLVISFWVVPDNNFLSTPCFSAVAIYNASSQGAGALMSLRCSFFLEEFC